MIKRLIKRLLGQSPAAPETAVAAAAATVPRIPLGQRVEVPASVHGIDPKLVDDRAVKVVHTLKQAGYEAYVVGGAVRDLLVGIRPKDFDVATTAKPPEIREVFGARRTVGNLRHGNR